VGGDTPERPESVLGETVIGAPEIVASQVDVLPAERGEVGEQFIWHHVATVANNVDGTPEIDCVPQHDGRRYQGQAAGPVLLGLGGAVVQAPEAVEAYGSGQRIVALTLVEFGRCLPTKLRLLKPNEPGTSLAGCLSQLIWFRQLGKRGKTVGAAVDQAGRNRPLT
jgi:hypothetical protein